MNWIFPFCFDDHINDASEEKVPDKGLQCFSGWIPYYLYCIKFSYILNWAHDNLQSGVTKLAAVVKRVLMLGELVSYSEKSPVVSEMVGMSKSQLAYDERNKEP